MVKVAEQPIDKARLLMLLKSQREELDQTIREFGGKEHSEELFDANSINGLIQGAFQDIVMILERHDTATAIEWARKWADDEWLKTT